MFWIILLCHFIADYPLQTDAMVVAKKTRFSGLLMHIVMHFLTMLVVLCSLLSIEISVGIGLALVISGFHFAIDYWKNILSRLRPEWVIFGYIQDQILHYLSILLVTYLCYKFGWASFLEVSKPMIIYAIGFILATHFWFVTERVLNYKNASYEQWEEVTMWSRMMSRGVLYSAVIVGFNFWLLAVITGAIVLGWNDLQSELRMKTMAKDFVGVGALIVVTLLLVRI
jgi:hypothetical protein